MTPDSTTSCPVSSSAARQQRCSPRSLHRFGESLRLDDDGVTDCRSGLEHPLVHPRHRPQVYIFDLHRTGLIDHQSPRGTVFGSSSATPTRATRRSPRLARSIWLPPRRVVTVGLMVGPFVARWFVAMLPLAALVPIAGNKRPPDGDFGTLGESNPLVSIISRVPYRWAKWLVAAHVAASRGHRRRGGRRVASGAGAPGLEGRSTGGGGRGGGAAGSVIVRA